MKKYVSFFVFGALLWCSGSLSARANENELVIGVVGVMSGPAAQWGLVNRYCTEVTAAMYNEAGGVEIGGKRYHIRVVIRDDELNPAKAVQGVRELIKEGAHYIIGPNRDDTAQAIVPLLETENAMNIFYGFNQSLVMPPRSNSIMGMAAAFQSAPTIYRFLRDKKKVHSMAFLPFMDRDSMEQRNTSELGARKLGLKILQIDAMDVEDTGFGPNLRGAKEVLRHLVPLHPDFISFPGVLPGDLPGLIELTRQEGYTGLLGVPTAQEPAKLSKIGKAANGFIYVGGNPDESAWSDYKREFVRRYRALAGEWHDEAGTKAYALEILLRTLQAAGPDAIKNIAVFKRAMDKFAVPDPFIKSKHTLRYVGRSNFGQLRQIGVPLIINEIHDGGFETIHLEDLPQ